MNPVPLMLFDPNRGDRYVIDAEAVDAPGIVNVAATALNLLGFAAPHDFCPSLLRFS